MKSVLERNLGFLGYSDYSVDTDGNVFRNNYRNTGKHLKIKQQTDKGGYLRLQLSHNKNKKLYFAHRIVARAFPEICGEWFEGCVVDHIDTNRTNNIPKNLKVCTTSDNNNNNLTKRKNINSRIGLKRSTKTKNKMRDGHLNQMRKAVCYSNNGEKIGTFKSIAEAARNMGVSSSAMFKYCKYMTKGKVGYGRYID